jgi:hypothetical protein
MKENSLVVGGFIAEGWNLKLSDWKRYHEIMADAPREEYLSGLSFRFPAFIKL